MSDKRIIFTDRDRISDVIMRILFRVKPNDNSSDNFLMFFFNDSGPVISNNMKDQTHMQKL